MTSMERIRKTVWHRAIATAVGTLVWSVSLAVPARATGGQLDPTFGANGKVLTNPTPQQDEGHAMALQADGKILVAGGFGDGGPDPTFGLLRYEPDGSLDPSFGTGGIVTTDVTPHGDIDYGVAVQPDGKILVAGTSGIGGRNVKFALARYLPDGTLDSTFGGDGTVTTDFTPDKDEGFALGVQPDGKIVVAGTAGLGGSDVRFAVARYDPDGSLDTTFGIDGRVTTHIVRGAHDEAHALAIQSDGKIVLAGTSYTSDPSFALVRYNSDGSLDRSFGSDGRVTADLTRRTDLAFAVAIQPDGKIVEAGGAGAGGPHARFAIARFDGSGTLDPTFGSDGVATIDVTSAFDVAVAVAIQSDGKIVESGLSGAFGDQNSKFALVRVDAAGASDPTFGGDGIVRTDFSKDGEDVASAIVIQPDGKIVAAGSAGTFGGPDPQIALARYLPT